MKDKRSVRRIIISIVLFVIALCATELSPLSRHAISRTNDGYGVLDMTKYDSSDFIKMMESSKDIGVYWKYYVLDFIFTAAFLNFMIQMVSGFKGPVINRIKIASYIFAVIRGLSDIIENSIMLNQIYAFPNVDHSLINNCNMITQLKFLCLRGWVLCFCVMIILMQVNKRKWK